MTGRGSTIVVDVSGHGFGHIAQVTPVIGALTARAPDARIVVRSALPPDVIHRFLGTAIETAEAPPEVTLAMHGPSVVDVEATAQGYRCLHARWDDHLAREAARLAALAPAVLVADVPYLSLAAAQRIAVPAVALCSLNWLDLYRAYCGTRPEAPAILRTIEAAYRGADIFLQPVPHMPMLDLPNRHPIGPIGRLGANRREHIGRLLDLPRGRRLVLATLGGIPGDAPIPLPAMADVQWITSRGAAGGRQDIADLDALGLSFIDVLASADAVVAKVGYSTFVEAACNGIGVVSAPRPDWPEAEVLLQWAAENTNFALASSGLDDVAGVREALTAVLSAPPRPPLAASGAADAAERILRAARLD